MTFKNYYTENIGKMLRQQEKNYFYWGARKGYVKEVTFQLHFEGAVGF